MIKIIATDMDHTLLDDASVLPTDFNQLLDDLETKDINFVCASGRSLASLHKKVHENKDRISFVSDNGALVEHQGKIIYKNTIEQKEWHAMVSVGRDCLETSTILTTLACAYVEVHNDAHAEMLKEYYPSFKIVDDLTALDVEVIKVTYLSMENTRDNYTRLVEPHFGSRFNTVQSGLVWIDIMNQDVNKGNGLKILLEKLNLNKDNLMSFGDYHNDIEMLKLAKYSFAVSNAHQDVKDIASEVIGSNNDNSVIKTIIERVIAK